MPIYMHYQGIDGDVTSKGHEKWIEVGHCSLNVSRHMETSVGAATRRSAGVPSFSDIQISKEVDNSSGKLQHESLFGTEGKKVKIDFVSADNEIYLQVETDNTLIATYSLGGSGGAGNSNPGENLSLNFTKITYTPKQRQETGAKASQPMRVIYDLATANKA